MAIKFLSKSEKETLSFGISLGKKLKPGDIICLFGQLGSGKTVLTKGIARGLQTEDKNIQSPTFTLMNVHPAKKIPLYHFDLYRIEKTKEIESIGYEDFFYGQGISVVEWADKLGNLLPKKYLSIKIQHKSEDERLFTISPKGVRYKELLEVLNK